MPRSSTKRCPVTVSPPYDGVAFLHAAMLGWVDRCPGEVTVSFPTVEGVVRGRQWFLDCISENHMLRRPLPMDFVIFFYY